mmetsp:Transcript_14213/g.38031  ORF Transcript_14213/g.38031 Transcript_14213/m.38031 type:complete len:235 (+) Transcript_14213:155-859(+)
MRPHRNACPLVRLRWLHLRVLKHVYTRQQKMKTMTWIWMSMARKLQHLPSPRLTFRWTRSATITFLKLVPRRSATPRRVSRQCSPLDGRFPSKRPRRACVSSFSIQSTRRSAPARRKRTVPRTSRRAPKSHGTWDKWRTKRKRAKSSIGWTSKKRFWRDQFEARLVQMRGPLRYRKSLRNVRGWTRPPVSLDPLIRVPLYRRQCGRMFPTTQRRPGLSAVVLRVWLPTLQLLHL